MSLLQIYWRALGYLASDRKRVAFICAANVTLAIITILEPILFGRVIDAMSDKQDVVPTLVLWAGLGAFNIIAFVWVARGADRFAHARRGDLLCQSFERVITMPLSWHQQRGTSTALHTLLRATEALFGLWLEFMRQHLSAAVALCLLVPTALHLDVRMATVLLVLGAIYVAVGRLVMRKTKAGQANVERHYHQVFGHVTDAVSNVSVLQSYNRIGLEAEMLRQHVRNLLNAQYPVLDWWAIASALQRLSSTISMMVVLLIGAYLVTHGQLRIGDVVAFTGFATVLIARLDQISAFVNQISDNRAKLEEFYRLEDAAAEGVEPEGMRDLGAVTGHVRFDNVSFEFSKSGQGVHDVSFEVQAGQTIAIVGPTGAGKTTVINLLQRVFTPDSGRILIDGIDTRTVTRRSLRHSIATVFQDAGLLNRSIEDNIRVGRAEKSPALVADGSHIMTDVVTSIGVFIGLVGAVLTGWRILDPALAVIVALNILWQGWHVIGSSMNGLMDRAVDTQEHMRIRDLISSNCKGALEVHDLKTRIAGRATFIEFHLVVDAGMTVGDSHVICDRIEDALKAEIPSVRVTIHVEPDDEAKLPKGTTAVPFA